MKKEEKITNKNMGINYSGEVKISVVKDGKEISSSTIHNTGCIDLFKFLTNCLIGDFRPVSTPQYLMIHHLASGDPTPLSLGDNLLNYYIFKANQQQVNNESNNNSKARFRFLIPGSSFVSTEDGNVISLRNANNELLAYLKLTGNALIKPSQISSDTNIIIVWDLKISN